MEAPFSPLGKRWYLPQDPAQRWFLAFIGLLLTCGATAMLAETPLALLPILGVVGVVILLIDWRWFYYILLATLAFSKEIAVGGSLSMDVPSEPLMLLVLGCLLISLLLGTVRIALRDLVHPLSILVLLTVLWASTSLLFSVDQVKSIKYVLAKLWYIGPFFFVTLLLVRQPADVWRVAGCHVFSASLTVVWTALRHATKGFSFEDINWAVKPFYLNHVSFATVLALLLPYALYGSRARPKGSAARWAWIVAGLLLLFGLLTSYTRASMLSLPIAGLSYLMFRLRLTRVVLLSTYVGIIAAVLYFVQQNNYMLYAPDFEKTVFNGGNFEKHLEATYKLQDVSGMERVYRWVAAARMVADKPVTGSGPATFYPEYKRYTVKSFRTYVSGNYEHSTTHNYFLLLLAEQGVPGCLIFVVLVSVALLISEALYHRSRQHPTIRRVVLATSLSLVVILFHLTLNELIEVDKIGSFFFIGLAVLIRCRDWLADAPAAAAIPDPSPTLGRGYAAATPQ